MGKKSREKANRIPLTDREKGIILQSMKMTRALIARGVVSVTLENGLTEQGFADVWNGLLKKLSPPDAGPMSHTSLLPGEQPIPGFPEPEGFTEPREENT